MALAGGDRKICYAITSVPISALPELQESLFLDVK